MPEGAPDMSMEASKQEREHYGKTLAEWNDLRAQESTLVEELKTLDISSIDQYNTLSDKLKEMSVKIKEKGVALDAQVADFQSEQAVGPHAEKSAEWNRLGEQEQTLFDKLIDLGPNLTREEYNTVLDQIKDVSARRKTLGDEMDVLFEQYLKTA